VFSALIVNGGHTDPCKVAAANKAVSDLKVNVSALPAKLVDAFKSGVVPPSGVAVKASKKRSADGVEDDSASVPSAPASVTSGTSTAPSAKKSKFKKLGA